MRAYDPNVTGAKVAVVSDSTEQCSPDAQSREEDNEPGFSHCLNVVAFF